MQILISWLQSQLLLKKPTDLDLHRLQKTEYIRAQQDKG